MQMTLPQQHGTKQASIIDFIHDQSDSGLTYSLFKGRSGKEKKRTLETY
jgi:hypothetical protein